MAFLHSLIFTFCFSWGCSMAMLVPNAARQLVTNPPFFLCIFYCLGGMLRSLWTCSCHVCFVNLGVWVGWEVGMLKSLWTCSRHVCFVNFGVWVGWEGGNVKVPVNLLTSCMFRELRGLGGVGRGGMLRSLWTCSCHVCFVNFGVWLGWEGGDVNVPVNLLTSCRLRELWGCLGYIYIFTRNMTQWRTHFDIYIYIYTYKRVHTYTFISTIVYIRMYILSCLY